MKKSIISFIGTAMLLSIAFGISNAKKFDNEIKPADASVGNYSTSANTYYSGITATSGKQLAAQLHDLITSTHQTYTTYDDNGKYLYQQNTDQYYNGNNKVNGYIYEFYSGVQWPNAWDANSGSTTGGYNREHCWCQSNSVNADGKQMWGENGGGADMHHLRPVEVRLNSTRSNNLYGTVSNRDSNKVYAKLGTNTTYALGGYLANSTFEPLDSKKGDVARIILYVYLHYNSYTNTTLFGSYGTTNGSGNSSYFTSSLLSLTKTVKQNTEAKALALMLVWNSDDPVDDIERRRNEQVAKYQGNRNPFIDNPSYADAIWGTGSSAGVTISRTAASVAVGSTVTLTATASDSSSITWSSSNTSVATVSSGVVTGVSAGSATITASATIGGNAYSATCAVTVSASGGSGTSSGSVTASSGSLSGWTASGTGSAYADGSVKFDSSSDCVYKTDIFNSTIASNMTQLEVTMNSKINGTDNASNSYRVDALNSSGTVLASKTYTGLTGTSYNDKTFTISSGLTGCTGFKLTYVTKASGNLGLKMLSWEATYSTAAAVSLSSIELDTEDVQLYFTVGDTFNYTGLVVTAHYSDTSFETVTPTSVSSPDMSSKGTKTITVTYSGQTATYDIYVNPAAPTSITATANKKFAVGETIEVSDITVIDNNSEEVEYFEFDDEGYQFTYEDATSGGADTNKVFTVNYGDLEATLTVQVYRKAYGETSDTLTRELIGVTSSTYADWSGKSFDSSAVFAGNSAGTYQDGPDITETIRLRTTNSNSGIVQTSSGGLVSKVSITFNSLTTSGRTIDIYGKNTAYSAPTDLFDNNLKGTKIGSIVQGTSTQATISGNYSFIGIRSSENAIFIDSIQIEYLNTAANVSNYIMYEDTNNQCKTKLSSAITKLNTLSSSEQSTFQTSNDYVIAAARERLNAWATHEGKTITYSNGTFVASAIKMNEIMVNTISINNDAITAVIIISLLGLSTIAIYYFHKRRKIEE